MLLKEYRPRPKLVTKSTLIEKPKFPVVDAHNHLEFFGGEWVKRPVIELLNQLDEVGVTRYVDLDGGWGEKILQSHLDHFKASAPDRFCIFAFCEILMEISSLYGVKHGKNRKDFRI